MTKSVVEVLNHHMSCLSRSDVDGLLDDYADHSVLFTTDGAFEGKEQMRPFFTNLVTMMLPPGTSYTSVRQDLRGDTVFLVWQADSATMKFHFGVDTMVIRDGKIMTHSFVAAVEAKE